MSWDKKQAQPKTDHPMAEELEKIRQRAEAQGLTHRDGTIADPPQGGSVIASPEGCEDSLPISEYTGEPYDPAWGVQMPPRPQADRSIIGKYHI